MLLVTGDLASAVQVFREILMTRRKAVSHQGVAMILTVRMMRFVSQVTDNEHVRKHVTGWSVAPMPFVWLRIIDPLVSAKKAIVGIPMILHQGVRWKTVRMNVMMMTAVMMAKCVR